MLICAYNHSSKRFMRQCLRRHSIANKKHLSKFIYAENESKLIQNSLSNKKYISYYVTFKKNSRRIRNSHMDQSSVNVY